MKTFWMTMLPFFDNLEKLPIPALARGRRARAELDRIIYGMIAERRRRPGDRGDLLSMLLMAQDVEGDGSGMTDTQVRDEAMTIFLAGHETTANALSWTWYLLGEHPAVEARMHAEIDRVLGGRLPTIDDVPRLPVVEQVVTEAMRLYPPAWIIGRRALVPYEIGGYRAPARSIFVFSPYIIQRDARWYPEPERFVPERWTAEFKASLPPFAYLPFGGGQRRCIGDQFAWTELSLVLATIAQRWKLRLVPGHPVAPQAVVTLRLKHGLKMTVHSRDSGLGARGSNRHDDAGRVQEAGCGGEAGGGVRGGRDRRATNVPVFGTRQSELAGCTDCRVVRVLRARNCSGGRVAVHYADRGRVAGGGPGDGGRRDRAGGV
jgi:cytochrome P450